MPRNASGIYSLPIAAYISNTTIKSADMNTNLSDLGAALTTSLATTGVSSMTGPIKMADGSAVAPSLTLATDTTTGWYKSATGTWTYLASGATILSLGPAGGNFGDLTVNNLTVTGSFSVAANRIIGEVVDYTGTAAPALWLLAFGQAISRTTYASIFGIVGTTYGAGDGVTTFNLPDYRGRIGAGRDDMGGSAAGRITTGFGVTGITLGSAGGLQSVALVTAELAVHSHPISDPSHSHTTVSGGGAADGGPLSSSSGSPNAVPWRSGAGTPVLSTGSATTGITGTQTSGSGTAHINLQPTIIINKIIYVGV